MINLDILIKYFRRPVLADAQQVLAHLGIVGVELGECLEAPPGSVVGGLLPIRVERPVVDVEPVDPR